jgi:hypothetical protein
MNTSGPISQPIDCAMTWEWMCSGSAAQGVSNDTLGLNIQGKLGPPKPKREHINTWAPADMCNSTHQQFLGTHPQGPILLEDREVLKHIFSNKAFWVVAVVSCPFHFFIPTIVQEFRLSQQTVCQTRALAQFHYFRAHQPHFLQEQLQPFSHSGYAA